MEYISITWKIICDKSLLLKALKIALVVGIILNIINQGEYIINFQFEKINFVKFGLTFFIPFCVSIYTAVSIKIHFHIGDRAIADATLKCKICKQRLSIKKNEIIPFCKTCNEKTLWKIKSIKGIKC